MAWKRTFAGDAPERVNKWLAQTGVCSRREAEAFIADGLVFIDGERVDDPGRKIAPGQTLTLKAAAQDALAARTTAVLNKPIGVVSAQPEPGQIPAVRLLTKSNAAGAATALNTKALAPVGRLDQDSRGLLLLSDDGVLARAIIGPQARVDKEYLVRVDGAVTAKKIKLLREGLELDGRRLKRAEVEEIGAQRLRFVLREGRNRQIRRMCKAVDLHVVDLLRTRIGPVRIGDLGEGRWRLLTQKERAALLAP